MHIKKRVVTSVPNSLTLIGDIPVDSGMDMLAIAVALGAGSNFNAFQIRGQVGEQEVTIASAGADFTSPAGLIIDASGDLTALAAGATGWAVIHAGVFSRISVYATCVAAGPTTATVNFSSDHSPSA